MTLKLEVSKLDMLRREVSEGSLLPRGYGVAWWYWDRAVAVCYPMPLNVIASLAHQFWIAMKHYGKVGDRETRAFQAGMAESERARDIQIGFIRDQHLELERKAYERGRADMHKDLTALSEDVAALRRAISSGRVTH